VAADSDELLSLVAKRMNMALVMKECVL
jgi:hypothetical protein